MIKKTGELPQASEAEDVPRIARSSPLPLPTEIMLQILGDALKLTDGVHHDRWAAIKRVRVDKFSLLNKDMSILVPEAFYTTNKVVIKPIETLKLHPRGNTLLRAHIIHPNIEQSKFVRELEFRPHMWDHMQSSPQIGKNYLDQQVAWLKKLASGALGFPRLDTLRIVLDHDEHDDLGLGMHQVMLQFISSIEEIGPLTFSTKNLEIVVDGHSCSQSECLYGQTVCTRSRRCERSSRCNERSCIKYAKLSKLLLAKFPNN